MKKKVLYFFCALSLCSMSFAQSTEKTFIKENMNFAAEQYRLMLKTPAQGKDGKGVMPHSMRKSGTAIYDIREAGYNPK